MKQKSTRWILISLSLVLSSLIIASPLGKSLAQPPLQITPDTAWDEGIPLNSEEKLDEAINAPAAMTAGTYYLTFSGTRFQTTSSSMTYNPIGGAIYATALGGAGGYSFSLDFDLPTGATITEVVFFVIDNDATNFNLSLRSYNPATDSFITHESSLSSGASASLQTILITVNPPVVVDNSTTSYRLRAVPGVASINHLLRGARVTYTTPTSFLPQITK